MPVAAYAARRLWRDQAELSIRHPKAHKPTGWIWTLHGPAHPTTVALADKVARKRCARCSLSRRRLKDGDGGAIKCSFDSIDSSVLLRPSRLANCDHRALVKAPLATKHLRGRESSAGVSEERDAIFFKHRASEIAGCERAGIQVYSIVVYLRLAYRCVAVDHNLSEAPLIV